MPGFISSRGRALGGVGGGLLFSLLLTKATFAKRTSRTELLHFPTAGNSSVIFSCTKSLCGTPLGKKRTRGLASRVNCRVFTHFSPSKGSVTFANRCSNGARMCLVPASKNRPRQLACATAGDQSSLKSQVNPGGVMVA